MATTRAGWLKLVVPVLAIVGVVVIVYFALPKPAPTPAPSPPLVCVPPPNPFFASAANIEVALTETIKVLKAQALPKVLDVIPVNARGLEMIGFLTCRAKEQGLITSATELKEYTELLGRIQTGNPIQPYVRHHGELANLEKHLRTTPADNFSLTLTDSKGLLARLEVDELAAKDWPSWFRKFCVRYSACAVCSPSGDKITDSITLSATDKLIEVTSASRPVVSCVR